MAQSVPRQPRIFGQMAATAAGIAVGRSVGHASTFGMGSLSHHEVPAEQQQQ
ncbi:hypothetical protein BGZ47_006774 [Haplosporangium gracile]|nr:hypothetical protein BGZ47_006774 [Haplosporangium gracile]